VVRIVRIHVESDAAPAGLAELVTAGPLDLLQFDYARPRATPVLSAEPPELPELATSFLDALRSLCTTLFLEPDFRVVSSAGWSNSYGGVENVARALVAGGSPNVPVSAVRGSNVMGILDYLVEAGLPLDNADTGAPWRTLRAPLLAADLQLGAGPILTALEEGGRVIVAGCYDGAAPIIAAGVQEFDWSWKSLNPLAGAAAAARAAVWPHRHACDLLAIGGGLPPMHIHPRIEVAEDGSFTVDLSHPCDVADAKHLAEWLRTGVHGNSHHRHADVAFDARQANVADTGPTQLSVTGCTGASAMGYLRLEVLYQAGFLTETMIEFAPRTEPSLRRSVAEAFLTRFVDADSERSLVAVQELTATDGAASGSSWLHLACRAKARRTCAEFADQVGRLATSNPGRVRLPAGRPVVQAECGMWPTHVPRGAVDFAVDTRPAKEWE
jgi:hypothetical protein